MKYYVRQEHWFEYGDELDEVDIDPDATLEPEVCFTAANGLLYAVDGELMVEVSEADARSIRARVLADGRKPE
jgi:hypothetical protein